MTSSQATGFGLPAHSPLWQIGAMKMVRVVALSTGILTCASTYLLTAGFSAAVEPEQFSIGVGLRFFAFVLILCSPYFILFWKLRNGSSSISTVQKGFISASMLAPMALPATVANYRLGLSLQANMAISSTLVTAVSLATVCMSIFLIANLWWPLLITTRSKETPK